MGSEGSSLQVRAGRVGGAPDSERGRAGLEVRVGRRRDTAGGAHRGESLVLL